MADKYAPGEIETKWQRRWANAHVARVDTAVPGDEYYMLMMFPYPSGDRLHVGHGRNYILGDALYRYLRMHGGAALNPMGWDAFGLPAENAAIQRGVHPRDWTLANIKVMKEQFRRWGILYDWSKEITSCSRTYYRWNQWLFLRMLENGLAYTKTAPVNWCPELPHRARQRAGGRRAPASAAARRRPDGTSSSGSSASPTTPSACSPASTGLPDWPEKVKTMQRNWIGRSEGAEIDFRGRRPRRAR